MTVDDVVVDVALELLPHPASTANASTGAIPMTIKRPSRTVVFLGKRPRFFMPLPMSPPTSRAATVRVSYVGRP